MMIIIIITCSIIIIINKQTTCPRLLPWLGDCAAPPPTKPHRDACFCFCFYVPGDGRKLHTQDFLDFWESLVGVHKQYVSLKFGWGPQQFGGLLLGTVFEYMLSLMRDMLCALCTVFGEEKRQRAPKESSVCRSIVRGVQGQTTGFSWVSRSKVGGRHWIP